jgi:hypothetical protein
MTDKELIEKWSKITDPVEAAQEIVEHEQFLGYDPYYRDLRAALIAMAARVCAKERQPGEMLQ